MIRKAHAAPEATRRVSEQDIATELGWSITWTRKRLQRHGWWLLADPKRRGKYLTYDAEVIEMLRALYGQPHREIAEPGRDWLSRHLGGTNA